MNALLKKKEIINRIEETFPGIYHTENDEILLKINSWKVISRFKIDTLDEDIIKCKILEWFSPVASSYGDYSQSWRNEKLKEEIRNSVNKYLNTNFSREDLLLITNTIGYAINRSLSLKFVNSNYDLNILLDKK